jgi:hypothetical protein
LFKYGSIYTLKFLRNIGNHIEEKILGLGVWLNYRNTYIATMRLLGHTPVLPKKKKKRTSPPPTSRQNCSAFISNFVEKKT